MTQWKRKNKKHEGFTMKEGMSSDPLASAISSAGDAIQSELPQSDKFVAFGSNFAKSSTATSNLRGEFEQIFDGIGNLTDGLKFYDSLESAINPKKITQNLYGDIKTGSFDIKGSMSKLTKMMGEFAGLISYVFQVLLSYLILIKLSIELFILQFNDNLQAILTKISCALTQSTAADATVPPLSSNITTFKDQTQKFLMLIMTWIFVYNWYYVCFYLKDQDNVRYMFNADSVMHYSSLLYGLFGPSVRALQKINEFIMGFATWIQTTENPDTHERSPRFRGINNLIYIALFFLFLTLVAFDFQSVLIIDFFNALHMQYGPSIMSIVIGGLVLTYAAKYLWSETGMFTVFYNRLPTILAWIPSLIAILAYGMWVVAIQFPLAITLIFAYLFIYSFFGVAFYQGTNTINTFMGISSEISQINPVGLKNDICIGTEFQFSWSYIWTNYIQYYGVKMLNWGTTYIFETMIILMLLGGIGVYSANFTSKFSGSSNTGSISIVFKQLFTWLIVINLLLIALIITFMVQKYNHIQGENLDLPPVGPKIDIEIEPSKGAFGGNEFLMKPSVSVLPNSPLKVGDIKDML